MHRSKCHLKNKLTNMPYRIKILFRVLMFGKPECDMFQPEPHSGEACNTLSHKSLTNVNIQKTLLYIIGLLGYCKGGNFNIAIWA